MPRYDAIFLMGPQGSGKGTQAKLLAEKLGFFHWEMGGILRSERERVLSDGKKVGDIIDAGIYLTDEQLLEVVREKLGTIPPAQGIIFDALPRRMGQAKFVIDWLHAQGKKELVTIFLALSREESLKRLALRAEIEKRADDTPEKIELRLKQYEEATLPILDYMKEQTRFIELDGQPAIPEVARAIFRSLGLENGN